jgi:Family of unknown function (DUF5371)
LNQLTERKKIVHAQTVLTVEDIQALKTKTGESNIKDALAQGNGALPGMQPYQIIQERRE